MPPTCVRCELGALVAAGSSWQPVSKSLSYLSHIQVLHIDGWELSSMDDCVEEIACLHGLLSLKVS